MHPCRRILLAVLAAGLAAAAAQACPNHTKTATLIPGAKATPNTVAGCSAVAWKPRAWQPTALAMQGLRIQIDPIDGARSMPTDDALGANVVIERDDTPLREVHHADGTVQAFLDGRFTEFAVVRMSADGKPAWTCVNGAKGAQQFLKSVPAAAPVAPAAPAVKWEEK